MVSDSWHTIEAMQDEAVQSGLLARLRALERSVCEAAGYTVLAGPFRGMRLVREASWHGGNLLQKTLGTYECELHQAVEVLRSSNADIVVNVGCAEGYYAIGLARMLPAARVLAIDIDAHALQLCETAAKENGVIGQMNFAVELSDGALRSLLAARRGILIVDCEGHENDLLLPIPPTELATTDLIVECHDFVHQGTTERLAAHFAGSHAVKIVEQAGRNPSAFPQIRDFPEDLRWLAMSEGRPSTMSWMVALTGGGRSCVAG